MQTCLSGGARWRFSAGVRRLDAEVPQVFFNAEGLDEPHELIGAAHQEMHAEPFEFVRADPARGGDYFSTM